MKNKNICRIIFLLIIIVLEFIVAFILFEKFLGNNPNDLKEIIKKEDIFAIMLEDKNGDYILSDNDTWPSKSKYIYNSNKSGCMDDNGEVLENVLEYDADLNKAKVITNASLKCFLYFDLNVNSELLTAYAIYSETDNSLRFYKNSDEVIKGYEYNGLKATSIYKNVETTEYYFDKDTWESNIPWIEDENYYDVVSVIIEEEITPISTSGWFANMENVTSVDATKLNTANVKNMSSMFYNAFYANDFNVIGLENFNTTNVTDMSSMFDYASAEAMYGKINMGDISGWDVSNVLDMSYMFSNFAFNTDYALDLSDWQVNSNVLYEGFNNSVNSKITAPTWSTP